MSKTVKYNEKKHKNRKWDKLNNKTKKNKRLFSKENYNSGDGMLTSVWGPSMWHYLHIMSFNYPLHPTKEEKNHYREFVLNLQNVLPCKYCRNNLKKNFKTLPLKMSNMENRETFSRYIYNLHELINKFLKKLKKKKKGVLIRLMVKNPNVLLKLFLNIRKGKLFKWIIYNFYVPKVEKLFNTGTGKYWLFDDELFSYPKDDFLL
jgi:hypothetical protein